MESNEMNTTVVENTEPVPETVDSNVVDTNDRTQSDDNSVDCSPVNGTPEVNNENNESEDKNKINLQQIREALKASSDMMKFMESQWRQVKGSLGITDQNMQQIYDFNEEHRTPIPDNYPVEQLKDWDHFNGLDHLTEDDVKRIFGNNRRVISDNLQTTVKTIKSVVTMFFDLLTHIREYKSMYNDYIRIMDVEETKNIKILEYQLNHETDETKRNRIQLALVALYDRVYLDFLKEPLPADVIKYIVEAKNNPEKINYWQQRAADKFVQLRLPAMIVEAVKDFETTYFGDEYTICRGILSLYIMYAIRKIKNNDFKQTLHMRIRALIMGLDSIMRNAVEEETKTRMLNNIKTFVTQFIQPLTTTVDPNA